MGKKCIHYETCESEIEDNEEYCILHSPDSNKDSVQFRTQFDKHIESHGYDCNHIIFPIVLDYSISSINGKTFDEKVSFKGARFTKKVIFDFCAFVESTNFNEAIFDDTALFHGAMFAGKANFNQTKFHGKTDFGEANFRDTADFLLAKFYDRVEFFSTSFHGQAEFRDSIFFGGARFLETKFIGEDALFSYSSFLAPTYFSSGRHGNKIFANTEVNFEELTIHPNDVLSFRNADLSKAVFRGTDCSNLDFSGILWAKYKGRTAVYDEVLLNNNESEKIIRIDSIEELYRQLKQNFANKRDYIRAGDFHYGEKEAIRNNSDTSCSVKTLLNIYKGVSGYGERILPPILSLFLIFLVSAIFYCIGGLDFSNESSFAASSINYADYLLNSIEVMFFLGGKTYISESYISSITILVQSILSPILLALLALSIRQKLKR